MVWREVLAVPCVAQQVVLAVEHAQRHRGGVPVLAVRRHVPGLGLWPHLLEDVSNRHAGPTVAQPAPSGDAVDVRDDILRRQRAELAIVERQLILDRAEDLQAPLRDVCLGYRPEVEERPAVRRREGLARRYPGWVHSLRDPLAFEEGGHSRAV